MLFGTFNAVTDPFGLVRLAPKHFSTSPRSQRRSRCRSRRGPSPAFAKVREAQRLRGLPVGGLRTLSSLAVPVLERGIEEAGTLAESMDARGHGRGTRSRYRPQLWTTASIAIACTAVLAAAAFLVASTGGRVVLHPATQPLSLPAPEPLLLAAIALLALPGVLPRGGAR